MQKENKISNVHVTKTISRPVSEVFQAIAEGRLFQNCGADHASLQIDFRVGGKYAIHFLNYGLQNHGVYLEIVPNQTIAFTWCQDFSENPTPDTEVRIEFRSLGSATELTLTHSGFTDLESRDAHQGGWNSGLEDVSQEIAHGRLRLTRRVSCSLEELYATCKDPKNLFDTDAQFQSSKISVQTLEAIPNQKIRLSWNRSGSSEYPALDSEVTLLFEKDDDDSSVSWLELIHTSVLDLKTQTDQRAQWDQVLNRLAKPRS